MNGRQRLALGFPPLLLRIALAITFLWAGLGKVVMTMPVSGERAATLANMGVAVPDAPVLPTPTQGVALPPAGGASEPMPADGFQNDGPRSLVPGTPVRAATPAAPAVAPVAPAYDASDFPDEVQVRRVYSVALRIHNAAYPAMDEDGGRPRGIWPSRLAQGTTARWLAWAVVVAELAGGFGLLLGLLTRLSALSVVVVVAGAMWLTEIGPAVQMGRTVLGFLPDRPAFDTEAWRPLLWQFMLFMAALAVVFAGPGMLALDNVLFGRSRRRADDDDDDDE